MHMLMREFSNQSFERMMRQMTAEGGTAHLGRKV